MIAVPGPAEAAVSCLTMPAEDAVATDPVEWKLLPRTAAVGEDGHLRVGDIDLLDLAAEFGTPLFVYDEYHLRQACRAAVDGLGGRRGLCRQGVPLPRHGPPGL